MTPEQFVNDYLCKDIGIGHIQFNLCRLVVERMCEDNVSFHDITVRVNEDLPHAECFILSQDLKQAAGFGLEVQALLQSRGYEVEF